MSDSTPPDFLCKYVTFEGAIDIISNLRVVFTRACDFNDPYDTRIPIFSFGIDEYASAFERKMTQMVFSKQEIEIDTDIWRSGIKNLKQLSIAERKRWLNEKNVRDIAKRNFEDLLRKFEDICDDVQNRAFFFCLTEDGNHGLMWAHYAKSHTGAVIKFRGPLNDASLLCAVTKVIYSKEVPVYSLSLDDFVEENCGIRNRKEPDRKENFKAFYTKSDVWEYEREWRCLRFFDKEIPASPFYQSFRPDEIEAVYLGAKMEDKNKTTLIGKIREKLPHAKIFQAVLNPRKYEMDLQEIQF